MSTCVCCSTPAILGKSKEGVSNGVVLKPPGSISSSRSMNSRVFGVRASMVDSYESSSNFAKRMEQAWLISQGFGAWESLAGISFPGIRLLFDLY
ncbi:hypothetical protein CK203_004974 [Vitis vinifera]|uniref:Uncharacterized protein n=1 Tax=Vitis vinifera TaxID=29760 RepID=A0A438KFE5_VITVI|nr:hypothetical protein CK203_004974 [Vitis vinifera]